MQDEDEDDVVAQMERRTRRRRTIGLAVLGVATVAGIAATVGYCRDQAEVREEGRGRPVELSAEERRAVDQFVAREEARKADPSSLPPGLREAIASVDHEALARAQPCSTQGGWSGRVWAPEALVGAPPRTVASAVPEVFVVGQHRRPLVGATEFRVGAIDGHAYLWDRAGGLICAGEIHAENSPSVDFTQQAADIGAGRAAVDADLVAATERAIAASLRRAN